MNMRMKQVWVIDHVGTGENMRAFRRTAKVSLREIARRMKVSAVFLSDLERGRRNWTQDKFEDYQKALSRRQWAEKKAEETK